MTLDVADAADPDRDEAADVAAGATPQGGGFRARPRAEARPVDDTRLFAELDRLRARFHRAARDGRDAFLAPDSDSFDIGTLAIINLADLVARELTPDVVVHLPVLAVDGLRATRNIAAHNYAALDNLRLWSTITQSAPALLDEIEAALRRRP